MTVFDIFFFAVLNMANCSCCVLSTKIYGHFRHSVTNKGWQNVYVGANGPTHSIMGFCEKGKCHVWHTVLCQDTCLLCAAHQLDIDLAEVLDIQLSGMRKLRHMLPLAPSEQAENIAVITNWKNGLDAKGIPLATNIKPAKK